MLATSLPLADLFSLTRQPRQLTGLYFQTAVVPDAGPIARDDIHDLLTAQLKQAGELLQDNFADNFAPDGTLRFSHQAQVCDAGSRVGRASGWPACRRPSGSPIAQTPTQRVADPAASEDARPTAATTFTSPIAIGIYSG